MAIDERSEPPRSDAAPIPSGRGVRPAAAGHGGDKERSLIELTHELDAHQIELEMQNEQLRSAQVALEAARDRYVDLYDFAPVGYFTVGADGLIREANLTGAGLLGVDRASLVRRPFAQHVAPVDHERWHRYAMALARDGASSRIELLMRAGDQPEFHARLDGVRVTVPDSTPLLRITLIDIDEHKRTEAGLRLAAVAFEAQEGIMITSADGVIERVNQAFTQITGYSAEEAIGHRGSLMGSGRQDSTFYREMWDSLHRSGRWRGELWNRRKSGEVYPQWLTITAVYGEDREVTHYVGTMVDISDIKARENEITQLAFYDPLTNLPNRRLMRDRLQQALATSSRTQHEGVLMFIDLDHFKHVNDTLGHDKGDLLLLQVARRLVGCVREGDTVARLGGDEFVVMLPSILSEAPIEAATQAKAIGEKILDSLRRPYELAGSELRCGVSIGITLFGKQAATVDDLLKRADQAMYQAKSGGRNTLRFFDESVQERLLLRSSIEAELRRAIEHRDLVLHYQPVVDAGRQLIGAEALLRWRHPQRGLVLPDEFIGIAEEVGLIDVLGRWALENACAQLKAWCGDPLLARIRLSVNVCAHQIRDPDFVRQVMDIIERHGVDPSRLTLELTESVLLHDIDETIVRMKELKANGLCLVLDDFGTGYSSLSYLRRLPLDQLKVDRSFVHEMLTHPQDAAIVRTVIDLGCSLGLAVVAEGVENETQYQVLASHGCQGFQGHLFGQPMTVAELEWLARRSADMADTSLEEGTHE